MGLTQKCPLCQRTIPMGDTQAEAVNGLVVCKDCKSKPDIKELVKNFLGKVIRVR